MNPNERIEVVSKIMEEHISKVESKQYSVHPSFENDLRDVFSTTSWGLREITLVIAIARYMNPNYKASEDFYACKPRPLYEDAIRPVLLKYGIPNRKSGPLNVAKAIEAINYDWARKRNPAESAIAVVKLVEQIEQFNQNELSNFITCLMSVFIEEAERVEELNVEVTPETDPVHLYELCQKLIDEVPDRGNTPQRIFGLLLHTYHDALETGITVNNFEDSASTTNTTSSKPGDVNEQDSEGNLLKVYEVTCKIFNMGRIVDSYESIKDYEKQSGDKINEILVVCRGEDYPADLVTLTNSSYNFGYYIHKDVTYYFINIYEWIIAQLHRLKDSNRQDFHNKLNEYVSNPYTAEKVKDYWKLLHENN